ncbi:2-hydroxyacid dehydrogenase [Mesorhizobium sp. PL10]
MALLFFKDPDHPEGIDREITRRLPCLPVQVYPEGERSEIRYLLGYDPPMELLQQLPNLKLILSTGAGADVLLQTPDLPDVPVVRMVHPSLTQLVSNFVAAHVLAWHRDLWTYRAQQQARVWRPHPLRQAGDWCIGVLGLGAIGKSAAGVLRSLGFEVIGWSRTQKEVQGIRTLAGMPGLYQVLKQSNILVSVLPLTDPLRGLLNRKTLMMLPTGSFLVNVGRGAHVVEHDLLDALDSAHLAGATLDVFANEPLPEDHPFWRHQKIIVTPHVAGALSASAMADVVASEIQRFEGELPLLNLVNRENGY